MINTAKVRGRIVEKGKTIQSIAPKIPCSPYILGRKIANESPMSLEEAARLSDELEIEDEEFTEFFCKESCKSATKNKRDKVQRREEMRGWK